MASEHWTFTREIWDAIERFQEPESGKLLRILKLSEEIGEVAQAIIGTYGANKRKGITHTKEDIAKELSDVIITAMVALEDYVIVPEEFFAAHVAKIRERVREQGS